MAATPVPAATVILLRDGDVSPEVLLLERHAKSEFLPDLYVFPGGRVDAHDHELSDHLPAGGTEAARRALPDTAPELAPALFVAAIRETFEEAGILLARRRGERDLLGAEAAQRLAHHRLDVQGGSLRFGDLVEKEELELASDLLSVHAHWITPELVPRRFDTFFFSALAPEGQLAAHDGIESTDDVWIRPEDALEQDLSDALQPADARRIPRCTAGAGCLARAPRGRGAAGAERARWQALPGDSRRGRLRTDRGVPGQGPELAT